MKRDFGGKKIDENDEWIMCMRYYHKICVISDSDEFRTLSNTSEKILDPPLRHT